MYNNKSQKIIWQHKSYPKCYLKLVLFIMVVLLFPIYLLTHVLILLIIFTFSIEIFYGILLYSIWMLLITILLVPLSVSLYSIFLFTIKFTESDVSIKPELLVRTKAYKLSTLSRIEIILGHRYFFNRSRIAGLRILFKLINLNGEIKKTYLFAKEFRKKKENMPSSASIQLQLISLRDDFENEFKNLKTLFPNIISLKDEDFPLSNFQIKMEISKRNLFFLSFWIIYILLCSLFFLILWS